MTAPPARWSDLNARVLSAGVMIVVGVVAIWLGGAAFSILSTIIAGLMLWELSRMTAPGSGSLPLALGIGGALCLFVALLSPMGISVPLLLVPAFCLALTSRQDRGLSAAWAVAIMVAGFGLVTLRHDGGISVILWLVLVVVASDVMGYFVGRMLGGPKFWPTISPKKTWSGTVAGWLGGTLVGLVFVLLGNAGWGLLILSPIVALAGQLGDIAESWLKRRAHVKDSSALIPGHGGMMDRFDAMTGASLVLVVFSTFLTLPLPSGSGG